MFIDKNNMFIKKNHFAFKFKKHFKTLLTLNLSTIIMIKLDLLLAVN